MTKQIQFDTIADLLCLNVLVMVKKSTVWRESHSYIHFVPGSVCVLSLFGCVCARERLI